jgi:hypothetical protein
MKDDWMGGAYSTCGEVRYASKILPEGRTDPLRDLGVNGVWNGFITQSV